MVMYKYPLSLGQNKINTADMHHGIISAGFINGSPCVWVGVAPNKPHLSRERTIHVAFTGYDAINPEWSLIGTAVDNGKGLVYHIFEEL